ncbi:MAG: pyridoxal-phosphate dependent enzyme [Desulfotignum sp.]|nr:pyridoxal-phosphate dependent enzyme [Desulfotignum sp.]MCF8113027.1 pyridoxal-phosphate dependent enzyme [Desulfotignum sp.]MCF8124786.1 pyridoxal-phosphate dependent enzyme [Desulfotignum sp.]
MNPAEILLKDMFLAQRRIDGMIRTTPLIDASLLSQRSGRQVRLKLENLQKTGSFKLRGAANALLTLSDSQKANGVLAFSTGNHGRAVAWVARQLGIRCVVCLSERVPAFRVQAMENFGAQVVQKGTSQDDAYEVALKLEKDDHLTLINPFDDPFVIAGQGTIGLEILTQAPDIDTLVVPVSGGGLAAGVAKVLKTADPSITVIGVSMDCAPAMYLSIKAGRPVAVEEKDSLADALLGGIGLNNQHSYPMVEKYVDTIELVTEAEIEQGLVHAFLHHGMLIEGAAAVTLAWLQKNQTHRSGNNIVGILSGGNMDTDLFSSILARHTNQTKSS